ncbi:hypothetical protein B0T22DRAFT_471123 [Podospora appendiculata]|uniref:Uncharacterized protein n=1 Tax=Podospora appendiculata TaxID=314037 RepID=A0AAE0X0Z7_9PEZI|nr:hypothetical protein B0T22DRAFT_471123 [Podospora appendiculata]
MQVQPSPSNATGSETPNGRTSLKSSLRRSDTGFDTEDEMPLKRPRPLQETMSEFAPRISTVPWPSPPIPESKTARAKTPALLNDPPTSLAAPARPPALMVNVHEYAQYMAALQDTNRMLKQELQTYKQRAAEFEHQMAGKEAAMDESRDDNQGLEDNLRQEREKVETLTKHAARAEQAMREKEDLVADLECRINQAFSWYNTETARLSPITVDGDTEDPALVDPDSTDDEDNTCVQELGDDAMGQPFKFPKFYTPPQPHFYQEAARINVFPELQELPPRRKEDWGSWPSNQPASLGRYPGGWLF